jgi:cell division inhibitor SulA
LETGLKVMPKWDAAHREKYDSYVNKSGPMNKVAVIDSVTKRIYASIKEAAKENGINYQTLFSWLTRAKHKNRTNLILAAICSNPKSNQAAVTN